MSYGKTRGRGPDLFELPGFFINGPARVRITADGNLIASGSRFEYDPDHPHFAPADLSFGRSTKGINGEAISHFHVHENGAKFRLIRIGRDAWWDVTDPGETIE